MRAYRILPLTMALVACKTMSLPAPLVPAGSNGVFVVSRSADGYEKLKNAAQRANVVIGATPGMRACFDNNIRIIAKERAALGDESWKKDGQNKDIPGELRAALAVGVGIVTKTPLSPVAYFKTIAWDGGRGPIVLNAAKVSKRSEEQYVGTFLHELSHRAGYWHNGNSPADNECTVPYVVGDVGEWLAVPKETRGLPSDFISCRAIAEANLGLHCSTE